MRLSHVAWVISPTGVGKKVEALLISASSLSKRPIVFLTISDKPAMSSKSA